MSDPVIILLAVILAMAIAVLSLLPARTRLMSLLSPRAHRIGHVIAYVLFAFVITLALPSAVASPLTRASIAFLVASGFGVAMETLQTFRPGRTPSWRDALVNAVSATFGAAMAFAWLLAEAG